MDTSKSLSCPTRLLDDTPASTDTLASEGEIGPHQRVATAIAQMILAPAESGGKMIGIEGGWGAGKTTVINLLRQELATAENTTLFCFDAWAHEGDPLRRTYLESLIRHFQELKWIDKTKWSEAIEILAKRRRVSNTRTVPKPTKLGKWFLGAALLTPLGAAIVGAILERGIHVVPVASANWSFTTLIIIGFLFATAPLIVLFVQLLRTTGKDRFEHDSHTTQVASPQSDDWAFLTGNAITEMNQDITETPDPTSIEFEEYFKQLLREALQNRPGSKVVVVLDNLDRVDPKDALSIWSTLQTYLRNHDLDPDREWLRRLWIVVPYDPQGLRELWEERGIETNETRREHTTSDSFIDKSFQVRFEVPPPILSNWKAYLTRLIKDALPQHSQDAQIIYQVYNLGKLRLGEIPTPRELKLYVNQIGAIHRQWGDDFPIGHIAYYVLLRRQRRDIRHELINDGIPDAEIAATIGDGLKSSLAGLLFNVRPELGQQLLLSEPIRVALDSEDAERIRSLEGIHSDGFWAVIEQVLATDSHTLKPIALAKASLCLEESGVLADRRRPEQQIVIDRLNAAATSVKQWLPLDDGLSRGISALCRLVNAENFTRKVVGSIGDCLSKTEFEAQPDEARANCIRGIALIIEEARKLGHSQALPSQVMLGSRSAQWIEDCAIIAGLGNYWQTVFRTQAQLSEILSNLCKRISDGQFGLHHLTAVRITFSFTTGREWGQLASAIEARLHIGQSATNDEVEPLLRTLVHLADNSVNDARNCWESLANGGHLLHLLHQAHNAGHIKAKAFCVVSYLQQIPNAKKSPPAGNSEAGHSVLMDSLSGQDEALVRHTIEVLEPQKDATFVFRVAEARESYEPFIKRLLNGLAASSQPEHWFSPKEFCPRWRRVMEHLDRSSDDEVFRGLVKILCESTDLARYLSSVVGFKREDAVLYRVIHAVSPSEEFRSWCSSQLPLLDKSTWLDQFEHGGPLIPLIVELTEAGVDLSLQHAYRDALNEYAQQIITGNRTPSEAVEEHAEKLIDIVGQDYERSEFRIGLLSSLRQSSGMAQRPFFEIFGEELIDREVLGNGPGVVREIFGPILQVQNLCGLRWLKAVLHEFPDLLDSYKKQNKNVVKDFRERIAGELRRISSEPNEVEELTVEVARLLNIKLDVDLEEDEADISILPDSHR